MNSFVLIVSLGLAIGVVLTLTGVGAGAVPAGAMQHLLQGAPALKSL